VACHAGLTVCPWPRKPGPASGTEQRFLSVPLGWKHHWPGAAPLAGRCPRQQLVEGCLPSVRGGQRAAVARQHARESRKMGHNTGPPLLPEVGKVQEQAVGAGGEHGRQATRRARAVPQDQGEVDHGATRA
jgi:hypothetical protein